MTARADAQQRQGRFVPQFLGGLLLIGLVFGVTATGPAQNPKADPKKPDPKAPDTKTGDVAHPTFPKLTIQAKGTEVPEMVKMINDKLEATWKANSVVPAHYCTDHEFIRRASLDIIGRIATPAEIDEYMKDPPEKRRSLLIERLLSHPDYPQHWADVWTNWLLSRSGVFGRGTYHEQLNEWLKDQFAQNASYDKIVTELLTAKGKNTENGAVNFILAHVGDQMPPPRQAEEGRFEMVPLTSRITRLFLGTQVQCAQCHDHPFYNSIKQQHFWGVNAFLRQVDRMGNPPQERMRNMQYPMLELRDNPATNQKGEVFFEKRNAVILQARAEFLASGEEKRGPRLTPGTTGNARRGELAKYVVNHEMFPKAIANRMWGVFMGRGFVNPVDDFNDNNPNSNPELLDALAAAYKNYGYDQKKLIRWICNSHAYNLSCSANKTNDKPEKEALFSRMIIKSISPEQLYESLVTATRMEAGATKETKTANRDRWLNTLVANFGDDEGNEVNFNGTVVQALLMMNGQDINDAVSHKDGTVDQAMKKGQPDAIIRELYLATLNRPPRPAELALIKEKMAARAAELARLDKEKPAARYQDLFWALLNSNEFLLNH
jgi:hypothetical protein